MLRPRVRIPLWAAAAIPVAAYLIRALVRGSLRPDLPQDAVAFGALLVVLVLAATAGGRDQRSDPPAQKLQQEHGDKDRPREDDEI